MFPKQGCCAFLPPARVRVDTAQGQWVVEMDSHKPLPRSWRFGVWALHRVGVFSVLIIPMVRTSDGNQPSSEATCLLTSRQPRGLDTGSRDKLGGPRI